MNQILKPQFLTTSTCIRMARFLRDTYDHTPKRIVQILYEGDACNFQKHGRWETFMILAQIRCNSVQMSTLQ